MSNIVSLMQEKIHECMHADVNLIRFQCKILRDLVKRKRSAVHRDRNASKHLVYGRFAVTILTDAFC